jgi:Spy/CpxP family protein refolding chaperone
VNAWKVIVSTLVIFIAGVLTGGLLVTNSFKVEQALLQKPPRPNKQANGLNASNGLMGPNGLNNPNAAANPWQVRTRELVRRMERELDLTPVQNQQIETIITAGQERMKVLWKPIAPQMNHEMQFVNSQIRETLTPDQQKKFDEFAKARPAGERRRGMTNAPGNSPTNSVPTNAAPATP